MLGGSVWNSSYLLGNDSVWGTRYFFTFYSEFGDRPGAEVVEVTLLSAVFIASLASNLCIAAAVLRYREMRTVTNCFVLNLAVADCLFALGVPAIVVHRLHPGWCLGGVVCKLLPYSQFVCGFVLLWTLTLISMDRYRCIAVPPYRSPLTPRLAALLNVTVWGLAVLLFLPVVFIFNEDPSLQICTLVFPRTNYGSMSVWFTMPAIFFTCLLPMSLLVFHYQRIFQKLLNTRHRWASSANISRISAGRKISIQQIVYPARNPSLTNNEELRFKKHVRVVRILLLNVFVVLIMWLPITVVMFLVYVDGKRPTEDTDFFLRSHHLIWALAIAYLNTLVNPLMYGLLSENFRTCFSRLWFVSQRRRQGKAALAVDVSRAHQTPSQDHLEVTGKHPARGTAPTPTILTRSDVTSDRQRVPVVHATRSCPDSPVSAAADAPSTAAILNT